MTNHRIGTQEEWQAQREELLREEKQLTRRSDELLTVRGTDSPPRGQDRVGGAEQKHGVSRSTLHVAVLHQQVHITADAARSSALAARREHHSADDATCDEGGGLRPASSHATTVTATR